MTDKEPEDLKTYHVNLKTGEVNLCLAADRCAVAKEQDHFPTAALALEHYEASAGIGRKLSPFSDLGSKIEKLKPYREWHEDVAGLRRAHADLRLKNFNVKNKSHQIINFLAHNQGLGLNRAELTLVGGKLFGTSNGDSIQWINKVEQAGLALDKMKSGGATYYGFHEIRFTDRFLKKNINLSTAKARLEGEVKMREYYHALGNEGFELGHKDPRLELTDDNMVLQPQKINRAYRNNYIFDDNGLPRVPNPDAFAENPAFFYGEEADRRKLYEALKKEFATD